MDQFENGAKKDMEGKPRYDLIPKEAMDALADGLNCGIRKGYEPRNWEIGLPLIEVHFAAALRHLFKFAAGYDWNTETDVKGHKFTTHHIDNALAHVMMMATQIRRGRTDLDDRPTTQIRNIGE